MKRFKKIYIEITNVCNLSCTFCPKSSRLSSFMSPEAFSHILDEISPFTDYIYLHLLGEPLLHPNLNEILDLSFHKKIKVNITTNGTLIDQVQRTLLDSPAVRQINFSLHSFDANDYKNSLEDYVNSILNFITYAKENTKIINALRLWNLPPKTDNTKEHENSQSSSNQLIYNIIANRFNLNEDMRDKLTTEGGLKIADQVYLNLSRRFQWPDKDIDSLSEKGFCYGLKDHLGILVDGTVVPCCLDNEGTINLGNIFETPFSDIINSNRALHILNGFSKREVVEDLCKRCGYRHRFGI